MKGTSGRVGVGMGRVTRANVRLRARDAVSRDFARLALRPIDLPQAARLALSHNHLFSLTLCLKAGPLFTIMAA